MLIYVACQNKADKLYSALKGVSAVLSDNIKSLRKERGLTREELAIRLNVVRQTVAKWEKGLSVPDAEMLQRIAEVLEVSVTELLGVPNFSTTGESNELAQQLSRINEQLAIKNRRSCRIWKTVGIVLAVIVLLNILLAFIGGISYMNVKDDEVSEVSGEAQADYAEQNSGDADELSFAFAFLENNDAEHDI